jgi:hypothetical protein
VLAVIEREHTRHHDDNGRRDDDQERDRKVSSLFSSPCGDGRCLPSRQRLRRADIVTVPVTLDGTVMFVVTLPSFNHRLGNREVEELHHASDAVLAHPARIIVILTCASAPTDPASVPARLSAGCCEPNRSATPPATVGHWSRRATAMPVWTVANQIAVPRDEHHLSGGGECSGQTDCVVAAQPVVVSELNGMSCQRPVDADQQPRLAG